MAPLAPTDQRPDQWASGNPLHQWLEEGQLQAIRHESLDGFLVRRRCIHIAPEPVLAGYGSCDLDSEPTLHRGLVPQSRPFAPLRLRRPPESCKLTGENDDILGFEEHQFARSSLGGRKRPEACESVGKGRIVAHHQALMPSTNSADVDLVIPERRAMLG